MSDASGHGSESIDSDTAAALASEPEVEEDKTARRKWTKQKLRNASSPVWKHFKVYTAKRCKHLAICNTCGAEVDRGLKSSTTPLQQHLTHHHPEHTLERTVDQLEKEGGMYKFATINPDFPEALLKWLVLEQQPLSISSSKHFKNMVQTLSRNTKVPGRKALTKKLKEVDLQVRQAICKLVVDKFVACTTDGWSSAANEAFCSLTLQWLTEAFELISIALDCSTFPGSHTGEAVAAKLNQMLRSYGIADDHVVAAVTDTAPAMVKAGRFMSYDWLGCMAHLLELVTGLAFDGEGVKDALKSARSLVGSIKSSTQAAADLSALLKSLEQKDLGVIQDVVTRWWSTYSMIERLLKLKDALKLLYSTHKVKKRLSAAEWEVLEHVSTLLKPFMCVQKALEGEKYVTISLVPFLLAQLRTKLQAVPKNSPIAAVSATMLTQFNQRFGDGSIESLPVKMAIAAALDPRTKQLQGIDTAEHSVVWAQVKKMVVDAHPEPTASTSSMDSEAAAVAVAAAATTAVTAAAVADDDDLSGDMFAGLIQQSAPEVAAPMVPQYIERLLRQFSMEMAYFNDLPALPHKDAAMHPNDPLQWWRKHSQQLPLLSEVARKVLCIPATSASSERLFSTAGLTVTDKRSSLTGSNVGRLVFLKGSWEKAAELTNAAAAAAACPSQSGAGPTSSAITSSSDSSIVLAAGVVAFRNSITAASVSAAEQESALRLAATALPEGSVASKWLSGASGRGSGVPKAAAKGKAKKASKAKAGGVVGKKIAKQKEAASAATKRSQLNKYLESAESAQSAVSVSNGGCSSSSSRKTRASSDFFNPKRKRTVDRVDSSDSSDDDDEDDDEDDDDDDADDDTNESDGDVEMQDRLDLSYDSGEASVAAAAAAAAR